MEAGATQLMELLLQPENFAIMVGVWVLIQTIKKSFPDMASLPIPVRIMPLLPPVLCIGALFMPGIKQGEMYLGEKLLLGLILGYFVGHTHKIVAQTGLGKDERIEAAKAKPKPGTP